MRETVEWLNENTDGDMACVFVRLFRPFPAEALLAAVPKTCKAIAVLDRTKEPGSNGEPLYQDVMTALAQGLGNGKHGPDAAGHRRPLRTVVQGIHPGHGQGRIGQPGRREPKNHFTVGINDDVTHPASTLTSPSSPNPTDVVRAMFYGLGADGTVGANKNTIKIIGGEPDLYAQGYFVYDSKKSGAQTVSHLRFGPEPIDSPYLVQSANFIGCHQFDFVDKMDILGKAADGATLLLNSPYGPDEIWDKLPGRLQKQIVEKNIRFYMIDADKVAVKPAWARRTNTIMQTLLLRACRRDGHGGGHQQIKQAIKKTYGKKGEKIVQKNFKAVDPGPGALIEVNMTQRCAAASATGRVVPQSRTHLRAGSDRRNDGRARRPAPGLSSCRWTAPTRPAPPNGKNAVSRSLFPSGGGYLHPMRQLRLRLPARCDPRQVLPRGPAGRRARELPVRPHQRPGLPGNALRLQVYPDDCTGCNLCVDACPVREERNDEEVRALNWLPRTPSWKTSAPTSSGSSSWSGTTARKSISPMCAGCSSCSPCSSFPAPAPAVAKHLTSRLVTQLFGDRMMVANATGCSSIYGGNLPTTPWAKNDEGRGPAWSNSLFEDNAEFGMGLRLSADHHRQLAEASCADCVRRSAETWSIRDHAPQQGESANPGAAGAR